MDVTCSTRGKDMQNAQKNFSQKHVGKRPHWMSGPRCEIILKLVLGK